MKHAYDNFFEWTELYEAVANQLLAYRKREKRAELLEKVRQQKQIEQGILKSTVGKCLETLDKHYAKNEKPMDDIDPFTLMWTFNYGPETKKAFVEQRTKTLLFWIEFFGLDKENDLTEHSRSLIKEMQNDEYPLRFKGVPVMERDWVIFGHANYGNKESTRQDIDEKIEILWRLFEQSIQWADGKNKNTEEFENAFDKAIEFFGISWMKITSVVFRVRPSEFLPLDEPSRGYIVKKGMTTKNLVKELPEKIEPGEGNGWGEYYLEVMDDVRKYFSRQDASEYEFFQLSYNAFYAQKYDKIYKPINWKEEEVCQSVEDDGDLLTTEKTAVINAREGQGDFRKALLEFWNGQCAVTSFGNMAMLRASHIKPWSHSEKTTKGHRERINPNNGLLLSPDLDLAFDRGFITFNDDGTIKTSNHFTNYDKLGIDDSMRIDASKLTEEHKHYLQYHRDNIFKEN